MTKNNKGYLLAETLIAITVVATVITVVYAMIMNYYIKQDNEVTKYNTAQGLFTANQIKKMCMPFEKTSFIDRLSEEDYISINIDSNFNKNMDISRIYFSKKDLTSLIQNEPIHSSIKKFLKDINNDKTNQCDYRYVVIFDDNRYTVIGSGCGE